MTREEEIKKEAYRVSYNGDEFSSFVLGAEWADKTLIDKACEWAKKRFDLDYCGNVKDILNYLKSLVEE